MPTAENAEIAWLSCVPNIPNITVLGVTAIRQQPVAEPTE
jgi:hypothetical protein